MNEIEVVDCHYTAVSITALYVLASLLNPSMFYASVCLFDGDHYKVCDLEKC